MYKGSIVVNEKSHPVTAEGRTFKIWCGHCGVWHEYEMIYQGDVRESKDEKVHVAEVFDSNLSLKGGM